MAEFKESKLSLIYNGGLAATGQLHLYEFSRAVYGYSRLIQTIEAYRRRGRVPERIVGEANTDVIVRAPQQGSFIFDAIVLVSGQVIPVLKDIPFDVLFSYVMDLLKSGSKDKSAVAVELARIRLAEEKQRTKQSREETERIKALESIVKINSATLHETLSLLQWSMKSNNPAISRADLSTPQLNAMRSETESELLRTKHLAAHETQLGKIPVDDLARLTSRARPLMHEVGLPLRKSAETVGFSYDDNPVPLVKFDEEDISFLEAKEIDQNESSFIGSIKAYDRESGQGKFRELPVNKVINFFVPANIRSQMRDKISSAMTERQSLFIGRAVRNRSGVMTSFILNDIQ